MKERTRLSTRSWCAIVAVKMIIERLSMNLFNLAHICMKKYTDSDMIDKLNCSRSKNRKIKKLRLKVESKTLILTTWRKFFILIIVVATKFVTTFIFENALLSFIDVNSSFVFEIVYICKKEIEIDFESFNVSFQL